jgi:hypothetical protein
MINGACLSFVSYTVFQSAVPFEAQGPSLFVYHVCILCAAY